MFDLLITNGQIVDGSGRPAYRADVGLEEGDIAAIGQLAGRPAKRVISARGLTVAPGFIDTHAHSDVMLLARPRHEEGLRQGITTEILGQDGLSYAPLSHPNLQLYRHYLAGLNGNPDIAWDWSSVGQFRAKFDGTVAINTAYLIPHGAVRLEAVGMRNVPLEGGALDKAKRLIAQGMAEGAVGFSTGLSYYPATYSDTRELIELARVVAEHSGVFVIHTRHKLGRPGAVREALEIAERAGVKLHFSHFRTSPHTAGRAAEIMAPIDEAEAKGMDISLELYPYEVGSSSLLYYLPGWFHEGGPENMLERLADPVERQSLVEQLNAENPLEWESSCLTHVPSARNRHLVGQTLRQAGQARAVTVGELVCDLLLEERLEVGYREGVPEDRSWRPAWERDIATLLSRSDYMVGSDSIHVGARPHPRAYGTFPRLLGRYCRELQAMPLPECVHRMTLRPAQRFGLKDRGLIQERMAADIVIFDPESVIDTATYEDPRSFPVGIEWVIVNGHIAVSEGRCTGILAGEALSKG